MTKVKREKSFTVHWISSKRIGKTFLVFALSVWKVLKKAIAQLNLFQENFCASSKFHKNCKTFLLPNFYHLRYIVEWSTVEPMYYGHLDQPKVSRLSSVLIFQVILNDSSFKFHLGLQPGV